ncbi:MAG: hypothetical protein KKA07_11245 [Bacteroidetes bacterium]|nr:hypothetical protein [Bacteroidota bacterium]MBU1719634.1 hypothetical protein [Bacteroidota bacterium]
MFRFRDIPAAFRRCALGIGVLTLFVNAAMAQDSIPPKKEKKCSLNGYVKNMQTVWFQDFSGNWLTDNLLHNRLNFKWFPRNNIKVVAEARNRFIYGEMVEMLSSSGLYSAKDNGLVNLSLMESGTSWVAHAMIDRAYLDMTFGKLQIRAGRQRVNWGMNLVWNPNDVFNAFSFFDFDYEERPGMDGIRLQYYTGAASSAEFVYKANADFQKSAFAGQYKLNKWNYDFQFLGGYNDYDLFAGAGWAGQIKGGGFRGEATYFHPSDNFSDTSGQVVAAISGDYSFKKGLYLHGGVLYNSAGSDKRRGTGSMFTLDSGGMSAKSLSASMLSIFAQVSTPLHPLLRADLAAMINPHDGSFFTGPSFSFSASQNIEMMLSTQLFFGPKQSEFGDIGYLGYLRVRYSF